MDNSRDQVKWTKWTTLGTRYSGQNGQHQGPGLVDKMENIMVQVHVVDKLDNFSDQVQLTKWTKLGQMVKWTKWTTFGTRNSGKNKQLQIPGIVYKMDKIRGQVQWTKWTTLCFKYMQQTNLTSLATRLS